MNKKLSGFFEVFVNQKLNISTICKMQMQILVQIVAMFIVDNYRNCESL